MLKQIYRLSDEGMCECCVHDPYFQRFTGEEFFQHVFPHERLSHWRKRLGGKLHSCWPRACGYEHQAGALRSQDLERVTTPR